jgi:hypothetical protein
MKNKKPRYNTTKISKDDLPEFTGQIIDIFEDFLNDRNIVLDNPEKEEAIKDGSEPDELANIFGSDYGELQTAIESTMINWRLAEAYERESTYERKNQ